VSDLPWPHYPFKCTFNADFEAKHGTTDPETTQENFKQFVENETNPSECLRHTPDWRPAADAAVEVSQHYGPTSESQAVPHFATSNHSEEVKRLVLIFWRDPIKWMPGKPQLNDGQHRTCALKASGAKSVIYEYWLY
jgi:hypothetical protein